ncbi:MAG: hypothetical protein LBR65_02000 [Culturomica sp.]|jgi:hypothetical protein|nr:hypothetical protein [Culturomica sp.]
MKHIKIILQIVLALVIIYLGYKCYESIRIPERFKEIQKQRNERIVERLKDIRTAQDAYRSVYGIYTPSLDTLIHFMKYDSVIIVRQIGSLTDDQVEQGITEEEAIKKGWIIRENIKVNALENTFGKDYPIDNLKIVPFTQGKYQFRMGADIYVTDSGVQVPIFEAWISNDEIFADLQEQYGEQIKEANGEQLRLKKYPGLKVGSLKEANNNVGNWE